MDHPNLVPLQRHYLEREIDKDLFSVLRGIKSQHALVKQSCGISHFISKCRPVDLTPEQSASVNTHLLIRRLALRLRKLRKGSEEYIEVHQSRKREKQRLQRELKQQIRDKWTAKQAVNNIERQLQGLRFVKPASDMSCRPQRPAQKRLMASLKAPLPPTSRDSTGEGTRPLTPSFHTAPWRKNAPCLRGPLYQRNDRTALSARTRHWRTYCMPP